MNREPIHHFHATGQQVYKCTAGTADPVTYSWVSTPEAKLWDSCGVQVGHHYGGPTWESLADGSKVVGKRLKGHSVSGTIPWLLLSGTPSGSGIFSEVTYIQRTDTTGGLAPSKACEAGNVGETIGVDYTAEYYFFTGQSDAGAN